MYDQSTTDILSLKIYINQNVFLGTVQKVKHLVKILTENHLKFGA